VCCCLFRTPSPQNAWSVVEKSVFSDQIIVRGSYGYDDDDDDEDDEKPECISKSTLVL